MAAELIDMLFILGNCLAQVFGGMAAAALVAWASWQAFKLLRCPALGPWVAMLSLFVIPGAARRPFFQMMILFLAIGALALIPVGRAWREQDRLRRTLQKLAIDRTTSGKSPDQSVPIN